MVGLFVSIHSSPSTKKKFVLNLALRKELNPEVPFWVGLNGRNRDGTTLRWAAWCS